MNERMADVQIRLSKRMMGENGPEPPLTCPCGEEAVELETRYGRKDTCAKCGRWSWGGKPLVTAEVHDARRRAHEAFDPLWQYAHLIAYEIDEEEGAAEYDEARKRIQATARRRAYAYLAHRLRHDGALHIGETDDLATLEAIRVLSNATNAITIRRWWKESR